MVDPRGPYDRKHLMSLSRVYSTRPRLHYVSVCLLGAGNLGWPRMLPHTGAILLSRPHYRHRAEPYTLGSIPCPQRLSSLLQPARRFFRLLSTYGHQSDGRCAFQRTILRSHTAETIDGSGLQVAQCHVLNFSERKTGDPECKHQRLARGRVPANNLMRRLKTHTRMLSSRRHGLSLHGPTGFPTLTSTTPGITRWASPDFCTRWATTVPALFPVQSATHRTRSAPAPPLAFMGFLAPTQARRT